MHLETAPAAARDPQRGGVAVGLRDRLLSTALRWLPIVTIGTLLALVTWPIVRLRPVGGIDGSWQAGIAMALQDGLRWGVDVIFTYGPLGFLAWPQLFDPRLGALAWAFVALAHTSLYVVIVWLSLRNESWSVALPLAVVGALLAMWTQPTVALAVISLVACVELLRRDSQADHPLPQPVALVTVAALGVLGATVFLVKLNDGLAILGMALVTSAALTVRRAALPTYIASAGVGLVVLWLGARQRLPDLVAYVATGREIATGYSTAMGVDDPTRDWQYIGVAVTAALVGWSLWRAVRGWRWPGQVAAAIAIFLFCFVAYKQAFVRHGGAGFFVLVALVAVWIVPWRRIDRERRALVLAALVLAALGTSRVNPFVYVNLGGIDLAVGQAVTIATTRDRVATIGDARAELRAGYAIPASMLAAMRGGTVHVEPYETAVLWAYPELTWRPLPVMQPYTAYTERLDRLNAEALASESGPSFILRSTPASIDGRHPYFESPQASLEEVCRFVEIAATDRWQLLARRPTRCGEPEPVGTVTVAPGELVVVPREPRADHALVAHVEGIEAGPFAALRAFVHKSPTWMIRLTDVGTYRLVPETASGPLIMSSPASLGWGATYRPPTAVRSFAIGTGSPGAGLGKQPDVRLTIRFETIAISPL